MKTLLLAFFFFPLCFLTKTSIAQRDTSKSVMKIDLGVTRDKDIYLWPLFRFMKNPEQTRLTFLFTTFRYNKDHINNKVESHFLPAYIYQKSKYSKDFRLLSVLYPSVFRIQKSDSNHYFSFRFCELAPKISLFDITRSNNGSFIQNNLFFFLWQKNDQINKRSYLITFPLYWQFKNNYSSSYTFFPFFSKGTYDFGQSKYCVISPFYWQSSGAGYKSHTLFPLYWNSQIKTEHGYIKENFILPLYYSTKSPEGHKRYFIPLFYDISDKEKKSIGFVPFYFQKKEFVLHRNTIGISPLFWHYKDSVKTNNLLIPLVWTSTSADVKKRWVLPFFYSKITPDIKRMNVPPLFFYTNSKSNGSTRLGITPLFWRYEDKYEKSLTILPLFRHKQSLDSNYAYIRNFVFPVVWHYKSVSENNFTLFPFIWKQNSAYRSLFHIFPFLFTTKTEKSKSFTLFPFYSYGNSVSRERSHIGITPLYWDFIGKDERLTAIFPLYWKYKRTFADYVRTNHVLFPLYWSGREKNSQYHVFLPLFYSFENPAKKSLTILPFFSYNKFKNQSKKLWSAAGIFWHAEDESYSQNILFPIWWNKINKPERSTLKRNFIFPFYFHEKDNNRNYHVVFPLYWKNESDDNQLNAFLPFYFYKHSKISDETLLSFSLFYWKKSTPYSTIQTLFPIVWNSTEYLPSDTVKRNVLFPFVYTRKGRHFQSQIIFPVFWRYKSDSRSSLTFFPLYSYKHDKSTNEKFIYSFPYFENSTEIKTVRTVFPVYWSVKTKVGDFMERTHVLFPFYWSFQKNGISKHVIFPVLWTKNDHIRKQVTVFPIFSYTKNRLSNDASFMLTPLIWSFRNNDRTKQIVFPFFWRSKDSISTRFTLFPLVWSSKGSAKFNLTIFPIFSYNKNFVKDSKLMMITPLFWRSIKMSKKTVNLVPVFSYKKTSQNNVDWSLFYFLLKHKQDSLSKTTNFLWPLCERTKSENINYFRFAPVFWFTKSANFTHIGVHPLYYYSKTGSHSENHILWQLAVWERNKGVNSSFRFLWKFLYFDRYKNKDLEFRFLYQFISYVKKEGYSEKSFFPLYYSKNKANGEQTRSWFFYFYTFTKKKLDKFDDYYLEERIFWFIRLRSNYAQLKKEGKLL